MRLSDVLPVVWLVGLAGSAVGQYYDYYGQSGPLLLTLDQVQEAFDVSITEYNMSRPFSIFPVDQPKFSPAFRHQRNRRAHPDARKLDRAQRSFERALLLLMQWYQASLKDVQTAVAQLDLTQLEPVAMWRDLCLRLYPDTCDHGQPYRSLDGSCNNLARPSWGKALTCHARMSEPVYSNGINAPRTHGISGNPLPNPRLVSIGIRQSPPDPRYRRTHTHLFMAYGQLIDHDMSLSPDARGRINAPRTHGISGNPLPNPRLVSIGIRQSPPDPRYRRTHTHLFMAYGQLIDHDMSLSPDARGPNGTLLMCCGERASPACFPIRLPFNDPFFADLGIDCLNVVRTSSCTDCSGFHERRIVNQNSAFIDASITYGTSDDVLRTLRDPAHPEYLLMPGGLLPPSLNPDDDGCSDPATSQFCFRAGDTRVNQQPGIASLQILYAKQHNRIATELNRLFPWWDKETIFQETRQVPSLEIQ
ncbi:chorion peroxidase-like [Ixodes scapularis]